jgi:uncharacterized membrane protein (UPF0127 family)
VGAAAAEIADGSKERKKGRKGRRDLWTAEAMLQSLKAQARLAQSKGERYFPELP